MPGHLRYPILKGRGDSADFETDNHGNPAEAGPFSAPTVFIVYFHGPRGALSIDDRRQSSPCQLPAC